VLAEEAAADGEPEPAATAEPAATGAAA